MIKLSEILKDHATIDQLPESVRSNILDLLSRINVVRGAFGSPMQVTSGYRPEAYNIKIGGSKRSSHITGQAIDIYAPQGSHLKSWIKKNIKLMEKLGFYFEDFAYTKNWVHFTTRPPKSGRRFFKP